MGLGQLLFSLDLSPKVCCGGRVHELSVWPGEGEWSGEPVGPGEPALRTRAAGGKNLEAEP
ncbi:MAG: hypothetical protein OEV52_05340 [Dehalococcoidia bacterium]|nr:hypothetical protein [Dehalococcoidia bacterium]